jgi:hypothetical protein
MLGHDLAGDILPGFLSNPNYPDYFPIIYRDRSHSSEIIFLPPLQFSYCREQNV